MFHRIVRPGWLALAMIAGCLCISPGLFAAEEDHESPATAEADPHSAEHAGGGTHGAGDGGDHGASHGAHDPYEDALHGNAGSMQEDFTEVRSSLALWTFVVFCLLLGILWKFAWGPLAEALDRREAGIVARIEEATRKNEEAAKLLADHQERLAGTADEVRRILDEARRDAESQKQDILTEAQSAAIAEKERALQEITVAKNGALQELAEKSVDTAVGLAGKIVQRQLSPDDHASLISEALEHFPSNN